LTSAVVFAYHDVGVRCLAVLLEAGVRVPLVVTHFDDPAEARWFASVAAFARAHDIETLEDPEAAEVQRRLQAIAPDFIFSLYYRRMLPAAWLALAKRGGFNVHGSLLPKYRGRASVNWAVLHGERESGATLHEMTAQPDAGRIVDQQSVPIGPDDCAADVMRRVTQAAEAVLKRSIGPLLFGTATLREQDLAAGSYFGRRRPEDGRIDWSKRAREIHDLVRAVAPPYPGAFTDRMRVLKTRIEPGLRAPQGPLGPYLFNGKWFAACGDGGVLRLLQIEPIE
jgi:methionyl-tRNA formyltransferase